MTTNQITPADLARVVGGAPKYQASPIEVARRSQMTSAQRHAADARWKKVFASLSPERKEQIRAQAAGYANTHETPVHETPVHEAPRREAPRMAAPIIA